MRSQIEQITNSNAEFESNIQNEIKTLDREQNSLKDQVSKKRVSQISLEERGAGVGGTKITTKKGSGGLMYFNYFSILLCSLCFSFLPSFLPLSLVEVKTAFFAWIIFI